MNAYQKKVAEMLNSKKIVVVKDNIIPWHDDNGILYIGIEQFLLEPSSLEL